MAYKSKIGSHLIKIYKINKLLYKSIFTNHNLRSLGISTLIELDLEMLKLKPKVFYAFYSNRINYYFDKFYFSSTHNKLIIFDILRLTASSTLAAIKIEIVAKEQILYLGKFQWPIFSKNLSNIPIAKKSTSS